MPKCDVCDAETRFEDGYALTTREVTMSPKYWRFVVEVVEKDPRSSLFNAKEGAFAQFVREQASQPTGWLVCEKCSGKFQFDKAVAKEYAIKKATPPNCAPVDAKEVFLIAMGAKLAPWRDDDD